MLRAENPWPARVVVYVVHRVHTVHSSVCFRQLRALGLATGANKEHQGLIDYACCRALLALSFLRYLLQLFFNLFCFGPLLCLYAVLIFKVTFTKRPSVRKRFGRDIESQCVDAPQVWCINGCFLHFVQTAFFMPGMAQAWNQGLQCWMYW